MNEWITSKTLLEAKNKAKKVYKQYNFSPQIYHFSSDNTYNFCVSEKVKKELNL